MSSTDHVNETKSFTIGVFPLGLSGGPDGVAAGPPDDFEQMGIAMKWLQGDGESLLIRWYIIWTGAESTEGALQHIGQMASIPASWDMVLCYRDPRGDVNAWIDFVELVVTRYGNHLSNVQVTSEVNLVALPEAANGSSPRAIEALVKGVIAAGRAKRESDRNASIGFAVVPEIDPHSGTFWPSLAKLGGTEFVDSLDYVGLDMYPDVFGGRIVKNELASATEQLLRSFREIALPIAGIGPNVPIHICETGWPTGPERSEEHQSFAIETVLRTAYANRFVLNVTHWELFTLRDADSSKDNIFYQFGILRDDYSPKPAFERLCQVLAELR